MGYLMYGIYFALALLFRNQPHIAIAGIIVTEIVAFKAIKYCNRD